MRVVSITGILRYIVINKKIAMLQKRSMIKLSNWHYWFKFHNNYGFPIKTIDWVVIAWELLYFLRYEIISTSYEFLVCIYLFFQFKKIHEFLLVSRLLSYNFFFGQSGHIYIHSLSHIVMWYVSVCAYIINAWHSHMAYGELEDSILILSKVNWSLNISISAMASFITWLLYFLLKSNM